MKKDSINNQNTVKIQDQRGFTLFVALIVSTLLLSIGLSLSNIVLKQLVFSTTGKESQVAFYAADSGAECALYWDRKDNTGATVLDGAFSTSSTDIIYCGTGDNTSNGEVAMFPKSIKPVTEDQATTTFYVDYRLNIDGEERFACAKVTVSKWIVEVTDGSGQTIPVQRTNIDSRGYNAKYTGLYGSLSSPDPDSNKCDTSNLRTIERAVRLTY